MRRGVGISGLKNQQAAKAIYAEQGSKLQEAESEQLESVFTEFKKQLENFSIEHYEAISKNPELREKLTILCNKFNINILSKKNAFHKLIGNFYLQLSVLMIEYLNEHEVVEKTSLANNLSLKTGQKISVKDIDQCLKSIESLGGINIISIEQKEYISIIEIEHSNLLTQKSWTVDEVMATLNLSKIIAQTHLEELIQSGIGWLDSVDQRIYIGH